MTAADTRCSPLTAAHLDAVIALDQRLTSQTRKGFFTRRMADTQADDGATLALVALSGDTPVGYLMARILDGEFGDVHAAAVIDAIGIDPAYRSQGLARTLMTELETRARARGVTEIRSEADWSEMDLIRFFAAQGFDLAPHQFVDRDVDAPVPGPEETDPPATESVTVRSMVEADLPLIVATDQRITGRDRTAYYRRKLAEMMGSSGVRLSLVAENDGDFAGFVMARVDYGDFGRLETTAVIDTIGVTPLFAWRGIGRALLGQLMRNLSSLRVDRAGTRLDWNEIALRAFLLHLGFAPRPRLSFVRHMG